LVKREMNVDFVRVDQKVNLEEMVWMVFLVCLVRWDNQELLVKKVKRVLLDSLDSTAHRESLVGTDLLEDQEERENLEKSRSLVSRERKVKPDLMDQSVFQESTDNQEETADQVTTVLKEKPVLLDFQELMVLLDYKESPVDEVNLAVMAKIFQENRVNKESVVNLVMLVYLDTQDDQVKRENQQRNTLLPERKENEVYLDWSVYLDDLEHPEKKERLVHLDSMVSMD
jgi:hypothetical protein